MLQTFLCAAGSGDAAVVDIAPFRYSAVVFATQLDDLVWEHAPQASAWIGCAVLFFSVALLLRIPRPDAQPQTRSK